jgi:hypothetical protein
VLEIPDDHVITIGEGDDAERWTYKEMLEAIPLIPQAVATKEAAEDLQRNLEDAVGRLRENPMDTVLNILTAKHNGNREQGYNELVAMASQIVSHQIDYDNMTDAEKEAARNARELEDLRAEVAKSREEKEKWEKTQAEQEAIQQNLNQITSAITAYGFEPEEDTIADVAETLEKARLAGYDQITPSDAVKLVFDEYERKEEARWAKLDIEKAPKEVLEALRKRDLAQLKKEQKQPGKKEPQRAPPTGSGSRRVAGLPGARY